MKALTASELEELCDVAKKTAIAAGQYIQSQFDQHYEQRHKAGGDSLASQVVTSVDLRAQDIILKGLKDSMVKYDLGLLTEELPDDKSRATKAYFWSIDPMDGTLPFTEHRPGYAVSIALVARSGDPVIGVAYIPDLEECYSVIKGRGVFLNDHGLEQKEDTHQKLHFYMDRSFRSAPYFDFATSRLTEYAESQGKEMVHHDRFGGVRNAIGVMMSGYGCYFKFPKKSKGCGSIWDYAATRLFFEEAGLFVSDAFGERLHLNDPKTTFMNEGGILYATHDELARFIIEQRNQLTK